jgi:hypothetical protein
MIFDKLVVVQPLNIVVVILYLLQLLVIVEQPAVQLVHVVHNMDSMNIFHRKQNFICKLLLVVEIQVLIVVLYLMAIVVIQLVVLVSVVHDTDSMFLISLIFLMITFCKI